MKESTDQIPKNLPSQEERALRQKVAGEFREFAERELPKPEADWDLIWVLAGPEYTLEEEPQGKENETRKRLETGINLAREVTALRLRKEVAGVTPEDILAHGPRIFFNGQDRHNDDWRENSAAGYFESKYKFPRGKIVISENVGIKHTGDQFQKFPEGVADGSRKIVTITDLYHFPRVTRYVRAGYSNVPPEKIVLYPALPVALPVGAAVREIEKIPKYVKDGILPPEHGA